jgi:uncharacterized protein YndB with AHSA1/START domain/pimeloyl-ACP methyl ester carboxylesterase
MASPKIIRDLPGKSLTVQKDFAVPVARVWSAWTTAEKLARWWGPQQWPATSRSFDFRVGGHWHYFMQGPKGELNWGLLSYTRIVPMKELHAEDYFTDEAATRKEGQNLSRWEVTFQALSASMTRVTTKLVCVTEAKLQFLIDMGFEAGYTSALENLTALLEGRAEPQTVRSADGTPLVYEKLGSGPPVILVGGAMVTRELAAHTELAAALSAQFTVFNYDRRGRGDSGDTAPYAVEREIEDLRALLEAASGQAAVYAMSSGAILALRAAVYGLPITRLALWEPPFVVDPADRRPPADSQAVVARLIARNKPGAAASYFMTKIFGMPAFVPWLMRLTPYWKRAVGVARSLPYDLAVTGDYAIPEGVAGLGVPTLVLHGDHTQPLLVHGAQGLARTLPGAVLKVLPGVNHQVKTSDLAPVVANFLKGEEA